MARIRTIKPEFWTSEQIVECSIPSRLLFIGLWNFCDDAGIHPASPRRAKMEIFPADEYDSSSIRRMLVELASNGLILIYVVENEYFLQVTGWQKHQKIDKPTYRYPQPTAIHINDARRVLVEFSGTESNGMESSSLPRIGNTTEGGKNYRGVG